MALFLLCFIVFVIWFRVKMNKNNSQGSTADELFWEREEKANHARKKDISSLDYLTPDLTRLPLVETSDDKEAELAAMVKKYASEKMINLSQYSNTDLKEAYGPANLETLSNCDQSFLLFIRSLSDWGNYLFEKKAYSRARQVYEYSIEIESDISSVYINLGTIYAKNKEYEKLDELISLVEASDFTLKQSILKKLKLAKLI